MKAAWIALGLALLSSGCRSGGSSARWTEPVEVDLGSGAPERLARRAVVALVDSAVVAAHAPRVSATDTRYLVVFDESERADVGALASWRQVVRHAVLGSGRFLIAPDDEAPAATLRASCSGAQAEGRADVALLDPEGRFLFRARGHLAGGP